MPLHQFFAALAQSGPDYLLVPLANTPFNRAKSNIAWIEATVMAGAVVLAPNYLPEFSNGTIVRYNSLNKALDQCQRMKPEERIERVKAAQETIAATLRMSEWNKKREQVLEMVIAKKSE